MTRQDIKKLHGILKRNPGGKTVAEDLKEYKREEARLENSKRARHRF
jgi:hypothetical protein